jgi:hypothetical protein
VYDQAPEDTKQLMRFFARVIHEWNEEVTLRSFDWSLRHSYLTHLIPRLNLEVACNEIDEFAKTMLGDNWRDANYPEWFSDAIAPKHEPIQMVMAGLGLVVLA